jgi:prepilin-type N-terminal cleavage/methylation domain-containing protein
MFLIPAGRRVMTVAVRVNERGRLSGYEGFTLLELCIAVAIVGLSLAIATPLFTALWRHQQLTYTRETLLWKLREAQEMAHSVGPYTVVNLHKYQPSFDVLVGPKTVASYPFAPGVNYKDGYLQMVTGWISFDPAGDAHVAGVVRLVDGPEEADLHLYTGAGWVSLGDEGTGAGAP